MELPRRRILFLSVLGGLLGVLGGVAALVLIRSIGLLTNLAFFHRVGWTIPSSPSISWPTPWIPVVAVAGGLVVALLARWCPMIERARDPPRPWMRSSPSRVGSRRGPRSRSPFRRPWPSGPVGRSARRVPSSSRVVRWDRCIGQAFRMSPTERKTPPRERCGRRDGGHVRNAARGGRARDRTAPVRVLDARVRAPRRGGGGGRWDARGVLRCGPAAPRAGPRGPGPRRAADLRVPRARRAGPRGDRHRRVWRSWKADSSDSASVRSGSPSWARSAFGLIGLWQPRALGVGYDLIDDVVLGRLALATVATVGVAKLLAWWLALGSGTSGGTLAPLLLIGVRSAYSAPRAWPA